MQRRRFLLTAVALGFVAACEGSSTTAPNRLVGPRESVASNDTHVPGAIGASNGAGAMNGCTPRDPQYGTATIGPSGGELMVGPHRLIIPPGALTRTVEISGTSPEGGVPTIYLEPHGLQFKKPAGLILDAGNCTDVPSAVYINEIGVVTDPIPAVYSTWWHTVAVPIDHFSGYAVAF
jgi:hypothetical protein